MSTLKAIRLAFNPAQSCVVLPRHLCTRSVAFQSLGQHSKPVVLPTLPRRLFSSSSTRQARYVRFGGDPERPWDVSKWDLTTKIVVGVVSGGVFYYISHLEQVPETGRWRFMDVNPKYETALAKAAHDEMINEFQGKILPANHPVTRHITRVVTRILDASNLGVLKSSSPKALQQIQAQAQANTDGVWDPDGLESGRTEDAVPGAGGRQWELIVVNDDKIVNAAATYGNIIVFTGILPIAKDERGLAAILGHEIGHVVARHNSERYSAAKVFIAIAYLLEIIGMDFGLARILTTLLLDLPNSRTQEFEADKIGLKLCAQACYDPRAAPEMFARMGRLEKSQGRLNTSFLYTHPTSEQRIQKLEEMLPEAYGILAASPDCSGVADSISAFRETFASSFAFGGQPGSRWT